MSKKEGDEIIAWIESQPELDYIRVQANKTLCDYRLDKTELSERLVVNSREDLSLQKETFFQKILSTFWVPGANLRGKQVASKELDGSLDTTAKVMSVSTIWDFACTLPIFTYAVGGIARGLAGPTGFVLGFIILWASNLTGENSTNKTRISFDFRISKIKDPTSTKDLENYLIFDDNANEYKLPYHKLYGKRILKYICGGHNKNTFAQQILIDSFSNRYHLQIIDQEAEIERYNYPILNGLSKGYKLKNDYDAIVLASEYIAHDFFSKEGIRSSVIPIWSALENKQIL